MTVKPGIFSTVFVLSLSAITIEILLARIFSITQWNHLSFMVISLALFGFAASGTAHSLMCVRRPSWRERWWFSSYPSGTIAVLYSVSAIVAVISLIHLPLDFFQLPLAPIQSIYLFIAYVVLSIPFFFAGLANALAYGAAPEKSARIYAASMAGSALGAAIPALLISRIGEESLILSAAMLPLFLTVFHISNRSGPLPPWRRKIHLCCKLLFGIIILASYGWLFSAPRFQSSPSPYKSMPQLLQFPDTVIAERMTTLNGRYERVISPFIRFAPGLSLKYTEAMPPQSVVFRDADHRFVLYGTTSAVPMNFSRHLLGFIGYDLSHSIKTVLLMPENGGVSIACALSAGIRTPVIVHHSTAIADILERHYKLKVVHENPSAFLRQNKQKFDLIHLESWGTSLLGAAALDQQHLFTTESFRAYLRSLSDNGFLVVSRRLMLPPADMLRLSATAFEAATLEGISSPESHMAILRNWDTYTLILGRSPITEPTAIENYSESYNFDIVFLSRTDSLPPNRHHRFDAPFHHQEIQKMFAAFHSGRSDTFFNRYPLDIVPQTDDRPFPGRFLKWPHLRETYKKMGSRIYTLFLSGEVIVIAVFFVALILSLILTAVPFTVAQKSSPDSSRGQAFFFFFLGGGYIFVELFFIKTLTWVLGDPVVSFSVVLSGMLIFSAAGSLLSYRFPYRPLPAALLSITAWLSFIVVSKTKLFEHILIYPYQWRILLSFLILLPTGILLGIPFPLAMRWMAKHPSQRALAWASNGCASVLAAVLAAQVAISFGVRWILILGLSAYFFAFFIAYSGRWKKIDGADP